MDDSAHSGLTGRLRAVLSLSALLIFLGALCVFSATDRLSHERLVTMATLALTSHVNEQTEAISVCPVHAAPVSGALPDQPLPSPPPLAFERRPAQSRVIAWEDSGIGHMLLTDE